MGFRAQGSGFRVLSLGCVGPALELKDCSSLRLSEVLFSRFEAWRDLGLSGTPTTMFQGILWTERYPEGSNYHYSLNAAIVELIHINTY